MKYINTNINFNCGEYDYEKGNLQFICVAGMALAAFGITPAGTKANEATTEINLNNTKIDNEQIINFKFKNNRSMECGNGGHCSHASYYSHFSSKY